MVDSFRRGLASIRPINVASVPQLSPFRYPGGKTWFVPYVRRWLRSLPRLPRLFVEPFAGGAIISLTVAAENLAEKVIFVELDDAVASVWREILYGDVDWLCNEIITFEPDRDTVIARLSECGRTSRERAFQTLLRNRVQRGGILAPGASLVRRGENGRGLRSRWYPNTLVRRIRAIRAMRDRLEFVHGNGLDVIRQYRRRRNCAFFVDPPYTAGGKCAGRRLYIHNTLDHRKLFGLLTQVAGPVIMTYDDAADVRNLALEFGFQAHRVPMKNTHHTTMFELVLTDPRSSLSLTDSNQGSLFE